MADKWNPSEDEQRGTNAGNEEIRGIASEDDDEFEDTDDLDEEEEDEESTTF